MLAIVKWAVIGVVVGLIVGGISALFAKCLNYVTDFRMNNEWMVYLLPIGGLAIVGFYKLLKSENDKGTNVVLSSISSDDDVPIKMAPLIFVGTTVSHAFGASVGREGAALQLGGSIGNQLGKWFRFDEYQRKIMIMCGMSAAFSALFGTPFAAAIFAIEVATVGVMYFYSLLPCVISALVAKVLAEHVGLEGEKFILSDVPSLGFDITWRIVILIVLCGLLCIAFCFALKYAKKGLGIVFKNPFIRIAVVAIVFVGITKLIGGNEYYGTGMHVIEHAVVDGHATPYSFAVKLILTSLILGAGFKGGEIVPTFYIGATFGCVMGQVLGLPAQLSAAVGMTALFCGVTNCPISAILISFELFGFDAAPYIMLASAISYVVSGYVSLYSVQNICYSKYKAGKKE